MMKNQFVSLLILLTVTSACTEDILDLKPLDALTPEQAFNTEENLKMYINSLYELPGTFPSTNFIVGVPAPSGIGEFQYVTDARSDLTFNGQFVEKYYVPGAFTP